MGQYYRIAYKSNKDNKVYVNDRKIENCDYVMAKLTEHSYFGNVVMDSVAKMLEDNETTKLAWVGDYSEEEIKKVTEDFDYVDVWGEQVYNKTLFKKVKFAYKGKYLLNHTKKQYISFDDYRKESRKNGVEKGWELNPISILTAIGNGMGGGDYEGINMNMVGSWAWDDISISKEIPSALYEGLNIYFKETFGDEENV